MEGNKKTPCCEGEKKEEIEKVLKHLQEALIENDWHCIVVTKQVRVLVP